MVCIWYSVYCVNIYFSVFFTLSWCFQATTYKGSPTNYLDAGIVSDRFIYNIQSRCTPNSKVSFSLGQSPLNFTKGIYKISMKNHIWSHFPCVHIYTSSLLRRIYCNQVIWRTKFLFCQNQRWDASKGWTFG